VRIIAGSHRGQTIYAPKGMDTRPTGDRVRESVFNLIGPVDGASVLDLFAGSGALGLEALSRGAGRAVFVESNPEAVRVIGRNLDKLRLAAEVRADDALRFLATDRRRFDLVLVDPPYERFAEFEPRLARYLPGALSVNGLLVVETASSEEPELPLAKRTSRRYGAARITLFEQC
jgi:16S rRNA (guanine966-N2)-methyltransferase